MLTSTLASRYQLAVDSRTASCYARQQSPSTPYARQPSPNTPYARQHSPSTPYASSTCRTRRTHDNTRRARRTHDSTRRAQHAQYAKRLTSAHFRHGTTLGPLHWASFTSLNMPLAIFSVNIPLGFTATAHVND